MGNKGSLASPFPSYETALAHLTPAEVQHLGNSFKSMSRGRDALTLQGFLEVGLQSWALYHNASFSPVLFFFLPHKQYAKCTSYAKRHILPRLFSTIDVKKDGLVDFEEFLCAVALFRVGSNEDKIKVLFLMYEPSAKTGCLMREQLRLLLVDSLLLAQRGQELPLPLLQSWIEEQQELSQGMVDMALFQYSSEGVSISAAAAGVDKRGDGGSSVGGDGRLDLAEFATFVALEGSIQGLLSFLPQILDI
jgi:Ca2+-binding EF-hand superfamily protein